MARLIQNAFNTGSYKATKKYTNKKKLRAKHKLERNNKKKGRKK